MGVSDPQATRRVGRKEVTGERNGAMMKVGNERDYEGSSSVENSVEEMVEDVQEGEHVEPTAVAGRDADRDREDLHYDERAPTRNVRNPKDTTRGKTTRGDIHCTGFGVQSARGPAQGQGVR